MSTLRATTRSPVRGVARFAAAGQVYADRNSDVDFVVEPHTARTFSEGPLDELTRRCDIVMFDHPRIGEAAGRGLFLPLDEHLPADVLDDRRRHRVGGSYDSYAYDGHVRGLPIDAACIVCAIREDLVAHLPTSWDDVLRLAREGKVAQPFSRTSATAIYSMLVNAGATRDEIAFVPACYGHSNYTRAGFARHPVTFHPTPVAPRGAVLGGAEAAVSAFSANREHALRFVEWATGAERQSTIDAACGGQPAHGAAWDADLPNHLTNDFFAARAVPCRRRE